MLFQIMLQSILAGKHIWWCLIADYQHLLCYDGICTCSIADDQVFEDALREAIDSAPLPDHATPRPTTNKLIPPADANYIATGCQDASKGHKSKALQKSFHSLQ